MQVSDNHLQADIYLKTINDLSYDDLADAMTYKWFRLNTLYHIKDKSGKKVLFEPNYEQEQFYLGTHDRDIILKARQLGFTTFKMIDDLDNCLFIENFSAGCICHNLDSAKDIFRNKIKFAYANITEEQRTLIKEIGYDLPLATNDRNNSYVFDNGSSIKVGTSYRGDTLQSLHISEFGKICKKYPDKATEIVTGAFEAVAIGSSLTIESTAEGKAGYFYDYCATSEKSQKLNKELTPLDFKFHFFSWVNRQEYELDGPISEALVKYFDELENKYNIPLNNRQKAWYSAKWKLLGDEMKREYPTTPKEAFEQSVEGAYYAKQFNEVYKDGRITDIASYDNKAPVNTVCDIGIGDSNAIWFYQLVGNEVHILHYYENSGEPLGHYMKYIEDIATKKKWDIGRYYGPHDMNNREYASGGRTRKEMARDGIEYGNKKYRANFTIVEKLGVDDGIQLARDILKRCVFDEKGTEEGVKCLENYRKEWDDKKGCWRDRPLHDWASHGADAFRYLAVTELGKRKPSAAPRTG